jgi:hypothetical protein
MAPASYRIVSRRAVLAGMAASSMAGVMKQRAEANEAGGSPLFLPSGPSADL